MQCLETAKAAPARAERDLRNVDQLPGQIDQQDNLPLGADQAAKRISRRFGLSLALALVIAAHAGLGERRAA